jgi:hypothetical protein
MISSHVKRYMTSGWTGEAYAGIPAGQVGPVQTMQPRPPLDNEFPPAPTQGADYFLVRGQNNYAAGGPLYDTTLFRNRATSSALSSKCMMLENNMGCGPTPPMDHCRTLLCPPLAIPFAGGCVGPDGPVPPLNA